MEVRIECPFSSILRGIRMLSIVPQEGIATKCHHNQSAWKTFTVSIKILQWGMVITTAQTHPIAFSDRPLFSASRISSSLLYSVFPSACALQRKNQGSAYAGKLVHAVIGTR
jgi:hypothetical protein